MAWRRVLEGLLERSHRVEVGRPSRRGHGRIARFGCLAETSERVRRAAAIALRALLVIRAESVAGFVLRVRVRVIFLLLFTNHRVTTIRG
jgi:hypothetical protein